MNNIRTHKCETCNINIKANICDKKKDMYYFFCCGCLKNINVCSRQNCGKLFLLNNNDLINSKTVYILNSNSKFYLYDDIKNIVINKYESMDNLKKILKEKKEAKKKKLKKIENEKLDRESKLKELFYLNKLEFKNHGDCYSYIHYGVPELQIVLTNELSNLREKTMRQFVLANELHNVDLPLDERLKTCYEYINNINTKPIDDIIKSIKNEYELKNNTYSEDNYNGLYDICV
jgi:hypothetical protein